MPYVTLHFSKTTHVFAEAGDGDHGQLSMAAASAGGAASSSSSYATALFGTDDKFPHATRAAKFPPPAHDALQLDQLLTPAEREVKYRVRSFMVSACVVCGVCVCGRDVGACVRACE